MISLTQCVELGVPLQDGHITFSEGTLWYEFERLRFYHNKLGVPSALRVEGAKTTDPKFFQHKWMLHVYPDVLRQCLSADPFRTGDVESSNEGERTQIFKSGTVVRVNCWLQRGKQCIEIGGDLDHVTHQSGDGGDFMMRVTALKLDSPLLVVDTR